MRFELISIYRATIIDLENLDFIQKNNFFYQLSENKASQVQYLQ